MRIDELGLDRFIEALVAGQRGGCAAMLDHYLKRKTTILDIYQLLFQPALYRIGELWEDNRISVATEHMATAIVEGLMNELFPQLIRTPRKPLKAVISSVEGELHQVGGKMVADVFEMNGWDARYLGASTPLRELLRMTTDIQPQVIGLSLSVYSHMNLLVQALDVLQSRHPGVPVIVGGQGFRWSALENIKHFPNATHIGSLDDLNEFIQGYGENDISPQPNRR